MRKHVKFERSRRVVFMRNDLFYFTSCLTLEMLISVEGEKVREINYVRVLEGLVMSKDKRLTTAPAYFSFFNF